MFFANPDRSVSYYEYLDLLVNSSVCALNCTTLLVRVWETPRFFASRFRTIARARALLKRAAKTLGVKFDFRLQQCLPRVACSVLVVGTPVFFKMALFGVF